MTAYRIKLDTGECLGYRSSLKTAQILAKDYIREHGGVNEAWGEDNLKYVHFMSGERLMCIDFEEIFIEY